MKESHGEGLATHTGPESCGAARKGGDEALTGERAGRVFSRVRILLGDVAAVRRSVWLHPVHRYRDRILDFIKASAPFKPSRLGAC